MHPSEDSPITFQIALRDPSLESEDHEQQAQNLLAQLKELDEVESVGRVLDPNPPPGNKALAGFLAGLLTAEVNAINVKRFLGFLGDRLGNTAIELEVEANGKRLKVKASSQAELQTALEMAQKFITT